MKKADMAELMAEVVTLRQANEKQAAELKSLTQSLDYYRKRNGDLESKGEHAKEEIAFLRKAVLAYAGHREQASSGAAEPS